MSNSFKKICASSVTIREFDEYDKCLKVLSGSCPFECDPQVPITEDDLNGVEEKSLMQTVIVKTWLQSICFWKKREKNYFRQVNYIV